MKLEYFNVNETGAYILYLVSKKCKLDTVVNIFIDQYQIEKKNAVKLFYHF
ncbi:PqqD family peptide modification chaperone [Carnobacterium sp.]|uniref:PqqD family peptide modification chaperone n=1 Tax=Carnobacterium sp. TaxID=48221 RepID=UPI003FA5B78F